MSAISESYAKVESLIYHTCHKFWQAHGGDLEEHISVANYYFVHAYNTYTNTNSSFVTWLRWCIWHGLLDEIAKNKRAHRYRSCDTKKETYGGVGLVDLLDDLGSDAKSIVELIFDVPDLLQDLILENGNGPCALRGSLKAYLFTKGWTKKQIGDSFSEIKEAIKG